MIRERGDARPWETAMQVRYVQDGRKRAVELKKLLGRDEGFNLGVCKRFEELAAASGAPLDVLLIDASRADQVALEDDIRTARKYTDAPIVFVTGDENGQIRARGLKAGAEAVLPRDAITSSLIREVVERAATRRRAAPKKSRGGAKTAPSTPESCRDAPNAALRASLAYVEHGLARLDLSAEAGLDTAAAPRAADLLTITGYARRLLARDARASCECDGAALLDALHDDLIDAAAQAGVALLVEARGPAKFFVVGAPDDARLGLEAIAIGLLRACGKGSRLRIDLRAEGEETRLRAAGDALLVKNRCAFFAAEDDETECDYATSSLRCGAALLGLRPEQIDLTESGRGVVQICL
jgi:DNA-binding NarL/FixJ family response regulator